MDSGSTTTVEVERAEESHAEDERRPLADRVFIRELSEHYGETDGQYLHDLFDTIGEELLFLCQHEKGPAERALLMAEAKMREAYGWALIYAQKKNSVFILDRRRFAPPEGSGEIVSSMPDILKRAAQLLREEREQ